jgi:hypothetical protein
MLVCNLGWSCLEVWPDSFLLRRRKSNSSLKGLVRGYEDRVAFAGVYVQVIDGERLEIIIFSSFSLKKKKNRGGLGHPLDKSEPPHGTADKSEHEHRQWHLHYRAEQYGGRVGGGSATPMAQGVASHSQWGGSATLLSSSFFFFFFFLNYRFNFYN